MLQTSQGLATGRDFELPQDSGEEFRRSCIHFDTHFEGFTPLSSVGQITEPEIDCIVVPGWGGHALGSFRSHSSSYVWLRDSLPRHCPELRVWTYGYRSHLADTDASADVYEFAERFRRRLRILRQQTKAIEKRRPLIFIVHSLGGWVFKDAFTHMRKSSNDTDRWNCLLTYGALFFGVPSHGMNVEAIRKMVQDLPARYISALLDQQDGFRLRQRQHQAFCEAFDYKYSRIVQFFELKKSPVVIQDPQTKEWSRKGSPALLVSPASASYGRACETDAEHVISLDSNHSDMVKFSDHSHDDYAIVREVLREFIAQAKSAIKTRIKKSSETLQPRESSQSMLEKKCLQSLHFPEMKWRRNDIVEAADGSCGWIFKHPNYLKWSKQQHGLLWIKGKPGAGKSTVLKHALEVAELAQDRDATLASFFFHGRGVPIQMSVIGLFRSLLHQLLQSLPGLLAEFSTRYKRRTETEGKFGVKWNWQERELRDFFKSSVVNAAKTHKICLYIDALDECGEKAATDLVDFFRRFGSPLTICFSCRHYPVVALANGLDICVEEWNKNDIKTYIRTTLGARITSVDIVNSISRDIVAKSLGNFQWVVLVVPRVVRLYQNGNPLEILKTNIQQIPSELSDLYKGLLCSIDEEDLSQSLTLIRWITFAIAPLTLDQLRLALVMSTASSFNSIRECKSSEYFSKSDEELKRRILSLSQGLVEVGTVTKTPRFGDMVPELPVVQFIHQSVKEYLLKDGLHLLDKCSSKNVIGRGHLCLSRSSIKILDLEESQRTLEERHKTSSNPHKKTFEQYVHFLDYAFRFWLAHSEEAEKQTLSPEDLSCSLWKPSGRVMQSWNLHALDCEKIDYHPPSTLLHVALCCNFVNIVNTILESGIKVDVRDNLGRTPLFYAARTGYEAAVKKLLDRRDVDLNLQDVHGRTPLSYAVEFGHENIVNLFLGREDAHADPKDVYEWTPLSYAVQEGLENGLRKLLKRSDVRANRKDSCGRTPLWLALAFNHEVIGKVLLEQPGVDLHQRHKYSERKLLHLACVYGMEAIVKLLLERNAEVDARDIKGRTPLSLASQEGLVNIVQLLLSRSAKPNLKGENGEAPILMAMGSEILTGPHNLNSRKEVVEILLQRIGVKVVLEDINALKVHNAETAEAFEMRKQRLREQLLQLQGDCDMRAHSPNGSSLSAALKG